MAKNHNYTQIAGLFFGLVLMITIATAPVGGQPHGLPPLQSSPPTNEINGNELVVGDIVVTGTRSEGDICDFGAIKVQTTAPGQGKTQWLGIVLDTHCQAVVNAKWVGSLEEGPQDVVKPLLDLLAVASPLVSEQSGPDFVNKNEMSTSGVLATKTSEQHVFMYGYGGTWDKLTHKFGRITFSYNGQSATLSSQSGSCQGSKPFSWYEWVVDGCFLTSVNYGPSNIVWRTGRGDYHCEPPGTFPCNLSNPDGYYHSLYDDEDGHADGTSHCTFWWSGTIVAGVNREILQGCS